MASTSSDVPESGLGALLDDDYFLRQVFSFQIEDGLHECRLVCRKWKAVCDEMPVELSVCEEMDMLAALQSFPNAAKVSTRGEWPSHRCLPGRSSLLTDEAVRQMLQMPQLKNLDLSGAGRCRMLSDPESLFLVFDRLEVLTFELTYRIFSHDQENLLLAGLRRLTGLTALEINCGYFVSGLEDMGPFVKLSKLERLQIHVVFFQHLQSGRLMFPCSPLTRLTFTHPFNDDRFDQESLVKTMLAYSATLHVLDLPDGFWRPVSHVCWPTIASFSRLQSLQLICDDMDDFNYFEPLKQIARLTELKVENPNWWSVEIMDSILSLTSLQSLLLEEDQSIFHELQAPLLSYSALTRLTRLVIRSSHHKAQLACLAGLADLKFVAEPWSILDLQSSLRCMTGLTSLALGLATGGLAIDNVLGNMFNLKRLTISRKGYGSVDLKSAYRLTQLTALSYAGGMCSKHPREFLGPLNRLTGLVELRLHLSEALGPGEPEPSSVSSAALPTPPFLRYLKRESFRRLK